MPSGLQEENVHGSARAAFNFSRDQQIHQVLLCRGHFLRGKRLESLAAHVRAWLMDEAPWRSAGNSGFLASSSV